MGEDAVGVAVALEALRGAVNTGFARLDGRLDVALQRTDVVERDIGDLAGEHQKLEARVGALEKRVWIAAGFAASLGAGGASLYQILM